MTKLIISTAILIGAYPAAAAAKRYLFFNRSTGGQIVLDVDSSDLPKLKIFIGRGNELAAETIDRFRHIDHGVRAYFLKSGSLLFLEFSSDELQSVVHLTAATARDELARFAAFRSGDLGPLDIIFLTAAERYSAVKPLGQDAWAQLKLAAPEPDAAMTFSDMLECASKL